MARKPKGGTTLPGVGVTTPVTSTAPPPVPDEARLSVAELERPETALVPRSISPVVLAQFKWFRDLSDDERVEVEEHGKGITQALMQAGRSRLAIGAHLSRL